MGNKMCRQQEGAEKSSWWGKSQPPWSKLMSRVKLCPTNTHQHSNNMKKDISEEPPVRSRKHGTHSQSTELVKSTPSPNSSGWVEVDLRTPTTPELTGPIPPPRKHRSKSRERKPETRSCEDLMSEKLLGEKNIQAQKLSKSNEDLIDRNVFNNAKEDNKLVQKSNNDIEEISVTANTNLLDSSKPINKEDVNNLNNFDKTDYNNININNSYNLKKPDYEIDSITTNLGLRYDDPDFDAFVISKSEYDGMLPVEEPIIVKTVVKKKICDVCDKRICIHLDNEEHIYENVPQVNNKTEVLDKIKKEHINKQNESEHKNLLRKNTDESKTKEFKIKLPKIENQLKLTSKISNLLEKDSSKMKNNDLNPIRKSPSRTVSAASLPGVKLIAEASSEKVDRSNSGVIRCRSLGSLLQLIEKRFRLKRAKSPVEKDDSWGFGDESELGLPEWDLGLIEHYKPSDASLPRAPKIERKPEFVIGSTPSRPVRKTDSMKEPNSPDKKTNENRIQQRKVDVKEEIKGSIKNSDIQYIDNEDTDSKMIKTKASVNDVRSNKDVINKCNQFLLIERGQHMKDMSI